MSEEEYISGEEEEEEEVDEEELEEEEEEEEAPAASASKSKAAKSSKGKSDGKGTKRKKDPNRPKAAASAYMFFMKAKRADVVRDNPGISMTQVASKVAEQWRALNAADKKPYEEQAAADKIRAQKDKAAYVPPAGEKGAKAKRAKKDPNEPKRPMSAYFFFTNDKRAEIKAAEPNLSVGDVAKKIGALWSELSEAQKQPYNDKAAVAKVEYQAAMDAYKKK